MPLSTTWQKGVLGCVQTADKSDLFLKYIEMTDQARFACPDITTVSAWVAVVIRSVSVTIGVLLGPYTSVTLDLTRWIFVTL